MIDALRARYPSKTTPIVTAAGLIPSAGYVRVSTRKQKDGFSPEDQRDAIRTFAAQHGYDLLLVESDAESGHRVTREGYQRILTAVRGGVVHAVLVFMFDRWGRDGGEWVTRAKELERAGVEFVSVREGREEGGLMRYIRAGLGEEYSRQLAKRVRPAMERSVKEGTHHGVKPFGYLLKYTERVGGSGRYQAGKLIKDETTAWFVAELFRRYAEGNRSLRSLALWANTDPVCPRPPKANAWTSDRIGYILQNPTYLGMLRYNRERLGRFERSEPGSEFTVPAAHEALTDQVTFDRVQDMLKRANLYAVRSRLSRPDPIGGGVFRCNQCGGRMSPSRRRDESRARASYVCTNKNLGATPCTAPNYTADLAHAALVAQIKRLRFQAWDLTRAQTLLPEPGQAARAKLDRALDQARQKMQRHIRRFSEMVDDPTPEEIAAHRAIGRELSDQIAGLDAALAALAPDGPNLIDLHALHQEFLQCDLASLVDGLVAEHMEAELRALVLQLVRSATIVERVPERPARWLRAAVVWAEPVSALIATGLIELDPDVETPYYPATARERRAAIMARYTARKKAGLVGAVPPVRAGTHLST